MPLHGDSVLLLASTLLAAGCGGTALGTQGSADGGGDGPSKVTDASGEAAMPGACTPGQSVACVGPGGCSTSQSCRSDGLGFGPCECGKPSPPSDASTTACVPGRSVGCVCTGGGVSNQVCNDAGIGYGPCDCAEAGSGFSDGGALPDGYAPLPPPIGHDGYNAIWTSVPASTVATGPANAIFLPLYSAPDCKVVPPYGESYAVAFQPTSAGPTGTFPACSQTSKPGPKPCYEPELFVIPGALNFEEVPGGMYTLSAFNASGIATGTMNTAEGIVPLVVKNCL